MSFGETSEGLFLFMKIFQKFFNPQEHFALVMSWYI